jgi:hypothetical protein
MADFIQSRVYLIHKAQAAKPTGDTNPTKPKTGGDATDQNDKPIAPKTNEKNGEVDDEAGVKRVVGSASVKRRLTNLALGTALNIGTLILQDMEFQRSYVGNTRGAQKVQQSKQIATGAVQIATSGISAGITAAALSNPYIIGIWLASEAMQIVNQTFNYFQQVKQYNMERDKEIYESRYTRERLVRDVYNRR